jgi:hypothetical protein
MKIIREMRKFQNQPTKRSRILKKIDLEKQNYILYFYHFFSNYV